MNEMLKYKTALIDISVNNDLSNAVDIRSIKFISLILPTLDTCNITFQVAEKKDGTYVDLKGIDASLVTVTATTGGFATEYMDALAGHSWMKIKTSAVQTVDRSIIIMFKN